MLFDAPTGLTAQRLNHKHTACCRPTLRLIFQSNVHSLQHSMSMAGNGLMTPTLPRTTVYQMAPSG